MFGAIATVFCLAVGDSCLLKAVDTLELREYSIDIDSVWHERNTILDRHKEMNDLALKGVRRYPIRVYTLSYAFWETVYTQKGMTEQIFSLEYFADVRRDFKAYAVFRSGADYWFAKWRNPLLPNEGHRSFWMMCDPIDVEYEKLDKASVVDFVNHIDSAYHPLVADKVQRRKGTTFGGGFVWVSVHYDKRSNDYLVYNTALIPPEGFPDLYRYHWQLMNN